MITRQQLEAERRERLARMGEPRQQTVVTQSGAETLVGAPGVQSTLRPLGSPWSAEDSRRQGLRLALIGRALERSLSREDEIAIRTLVGGAKTAHRRIAPILAMESVCLVCDCSMDDLRGPSQEVPLLIARSIAANEMRRRQGLAHARIGEAMGGRGNSAVRAMLYKLTMGGATRWTDRDRALSQEVFEARQPVNVDIWG